MTLSVQCHGNPTKTECEENVTLQYIFLSNFVLHSHYEQVSLSPFVLHTQQWQPVESLYILSLASSINNPKIWSFLLFSLKQQWWQQLPLFILCFYWWHPQTNIFPNIVFHILLVVNLYLYYNIIFKMCWLCESSFDFAQGTQLFYKFHNLKYIYVAVWKLLSGNGANLYGRL